jgi:hypothetical protein
MPALGAEALRGRIESVEHSPYAEHIRVRSRTETSISPSAARWMGWPHALAGSASPRLVGVTGSQLDLLGFEEGDLILAIAGIPTPDEVTLRRVLHANEESRALSVRVLRRGEPADVNLTVWVE